MVVFCSVWVLWVAVVRVSWRVGLVECRCCGVWVLCGGSCGMWVLWGVGAAGCGCYGVWELRGMDVVGSGFLISSKRH